MNQPTQSNGHRMTRRSKENNYSLPGMYHITLRVADGLGHPFGHVTGNACCPDDCAEAPHMVLSALGRMVEHELLNSIKAFYPMVEVQDYVVMPEHMHFIIEVHEPLVSKQGHKAHLGQVIAGFKKGCNRRYWELTGQGEPAPTNATATAGNTGQGEPAPTNATATSSCPAVFPQGQKVPSRASSGRSVLFAPGYVDVMPLHKGQLLQQRLYIRNNPRSHLLRSTHRSVLQPQRSGIATLLSVKALLHYLQRECTPQQLTTDSLAFIESRLLTTTEHVSPAPPSTGVATGRLLVDCDSYGNRQLLRQPLLPVVCHRRDAALFQQQKAQCIAAAHEGAVLVSARIAKGEQDIIDTVLYEGKPVVLVADNGLPEIYHPSALRIELCLANRLLIVTPWQYCYRPSESSITVAECKAMNCVVQALCRTKDDWWKRQ